MKKEERNQFLQKLQAALLDGNAAAETVAEMNPDDGGSCNFDSAYISLPARHGISDEMLEEISEFTGCSLHVQKHWGSSCLFVCPAGSRGQGNLHSRMAEAMKKALQAHGFKACMYYQMD